MGDCAIMKDFFQQTFDRDEYRDCCFINSKCIIGEILKLIIPHLPILHILLFDVTVVVMSMLPGIIGVMVGCNSVNANSNSECRYCYNGWKWLIQKSAEGTFQSNGIGIATNAGLQQH